jgi:hypothetical protein
LEKLQCHNVSLRQKIFMNMPIILPLELFFLSPSYAITVIFLLYKKKQKKKTQNIRI